MSSTQTLRFGFPKGHTSFSIYSGSVDLTNFNYAHVVEQNTKAKSIRFFLYTTEEEARARHGDDIRKIYVNNKSMKDVGKLFRTISAPTAKYLGFRRNKTNYFQSRDVPAFLIEHTDTMALYDLDLSDTVLQQLMRSSKMPKNGLKVTKPIKEKPVEKPVEAETAVVAEKPAKQPKIAKEAVPATVKAGSITFAEGTTIADLKRMSFKVVIMDANNQPFEVETK